MPPLRPPSLLFFVRDVAAACRRRRWERRCGTRLDGWPVVLLLEPPAPPAPLPTMRVPARASGTATVRSSLPQHARARAASVRRGLRGVWLRRGRARDRGWGTALPAGQAQHGPTRRLPLFFFGGGPPHGYPLFVLARCRMHGLSLGTLPGQPSNPLSGGRPPPPSPTRATACAARARGGRPPARPRRQPPPRCRPALGSKTPASLRPTPARGWPSCSLPCLALALPWKGLPASALGVSVVAAHPRGGRHPTWRPTACGRCGPPHPRGGTTAPSRPPLDRDPL